MKQCLLHIEPLGVTLSADRGTSLYEVLKNCHLEFPCGGKGLCGNCKVRILSGQVEKTEVHRAFLERKHLSSEWCLACLTVLTEDLTIEIPEGAMDIQTDESEITGNGGKEEYAVAVDVGSTTVVSQLVALHTGKVLATCSGINPQTTYGADIISRIAFAVSDKHQAALLRDLLREEIGKQIAQLLRECPGCIPSRVRLVGNTVMHHLFAGYDVRPLSAAPFQSPLNDGYRYLPSELGWDLPDPCSVEFLPNISHFIGSDILAGIKACGMADSDEYVLLIDLGTNGEMVAGNRQKLWCTSTAAGPAFEGINISCGMRASDGAISGVEFEDGKFVVTTIGGETPKGLCGSGLVEAVDCLLQQGFIDFTGMTTGEKAGDFQLADGVFLTLADIREFQLAKAAIATGISFLLKYSGIRMEDLTRVYVTGGLGNHLNVDKIKRLGLLSQVPSDRFQVLPNAALWGCKLSLTGQDTAGWKDILQRLVYCPLETAAEFQDLYCEHLFFPYE